MSRGRRDRVRAFLETTLRRSTRQRYAAARNAFRAWCKSVNVDFESLSEEDQDWLAAEFVLDVFEEHAVRQRFLDLISALSKENPRARFKVAWRVLDVWGKEVPPSQAPAMPEKVAWALFTYFYCVMRSPPAAMTVLLCYRGLLRIGEAFGLKGRDVLVSSVGDPPLVIICLGRTKRGLEQRVCLRHPLVVETIPVG